MKCYDIQKLTHVYVDGLLSEPQQQVIFNHLNKCENCSTRYGELFELKRELQSLPRFQVPESLNHRIVRRRKIRSMVKWGGTTGLAAALTGLIFSNVLLSPLGTPAPVAASIKSGNVHFLVKSRKAFNQVQFSILLPEHVQLKGYRRKSINWTGRLNKGDNLLKLPVVTEPVLSGREEVIELRIRHGDASRSIKVKVNT